MADAPEHTEQQFQDAEDAFVAFAQACFSRLSAYVDPDGSPQRLVSHMSFGEPPGTWAEQSRIVPDYRLILSRHWDELRTLPEAEACFEAHRAASIVPVRHYDANNRPIASTVRQMRGSYFYQFYLVLLAIIGREHRLDLPAESILAPYRAYRTLWLATVHERVVVVPLLNVQGELQAARAITQTVSLAPLTDADKSRLWDSFGRFFAATGEWGLHPSTLSSVQYCLRGIETRRHDQQLVGSQVDPDIATTLTALRLLHPGVCGATTLYSWTEPLLSGSPYTSIGVLDYGLPPRDIPVAPPYILSNDDVDALPALVAKLQAPAVQQTLGLALRRFNQSYAREIPEDRVIDLAIALESTVLGDVGDELSYRLASRAATLLAPAQPPQETRARLLAMYKARSSIVHAGETLNAMETIKGGPQSFQALDLPVLCEDVVRNVLNAYLPRLLADQAGSPSQSVKKVWERVNGALDTQLIDALPQ